MPFFKTRLKNNGLGLMIFRSQAMLMIKIHQSLFINHKSNFGFTLVELLVAIAILTIVFLAVITSISGIQRAGRDAQRRSDLRNIQSGLQQYYADQNFYPQSVGASPLNVSSVTTLTNSTGNPNAVAVAKTYLNRTSTDPDAGSPYCYRAQVTQTDVVANCDNAVPNRRCQFYSLCARLESPRADEVTTCVCNAAYNYQITPL